jgi:hypothetical protein
VTFTDSELLARWKKLQERARALKRGKLPAGISTDEYRRQLEDEKRLIEWEWQELLNNRSAGKLTDRSRLDAVLKIIADRSQLHLIPVITEYEEIPHEDGGYSWDWSVVMASVATLHDLGDQWAKFVDKIESELAAFSFVELPGEREQIFEDVHGHIDRRARGIAIWIVDTQIWKGPKRLMI